jgi:glutamate synthase (NADPH/NADH) large chain
MSKMGISVVSSYRSGCNFEAIGLSRNLMSDYFPSMSSRISGMGLTGLEKRSILAHRKAFDENIINLSIGSIMVLTWFLHTHTHFFKRLTNVFL